MLLLAGGHCRLSRQLDELVSSVSVQIRMFFDDDRHKRILVRCSTEGQYYTSSAIE